MRRQAAPDPAAVAAAQTKSNKDTALYQQQLNMVDQITPYGNQTYKQVGTNQDGSPKFQATVALNPTQQGLLDQQNQFGKIVNGLGIQQASQLGGTFGTPLDLSDPTIGNAILDRYSPRFDQQRAQDQSALEAQLADKGLHVGSTAYTNAVNNFNQQYGDRQNQLMIDARNQAVQELLTQRQEPLNELSALMNGGQVTNPTPIQTPQTGVANTDVAGPIYQSYAIQQQNRANALKGLFGLGSTLLGGWAT